MALHSDLLQQARLLATKEKRRPKQASLRRSISAAYYALFHLLVAEASQRMVKGQGRDRLRHSLRRAFDHAAMKDVARGFASGNPPSSVAPALNGLAVQAELRLVANAFGVLQQMRHDADYDTARQFTRQEAIGLVDMAQSAFENWEQVRFELQADVFLVSLLLERKIRR